MGLTMKEKQAVTKQLELRGQTFILRISPLHPLFGAANFLADLLPQRQHLPAKIRVPDVVFNIRKCYVWSMNANPAHTSRFCRLKICLVAGELRKQAPIRAHYGTAAMKKEES